MNDNFLAEKQSLAQQFFKEHLELLFFDNGFGVLDLKPHDSGLSN
jgi:hypothetical protein